MPYPGQVFDEFFRFDSSNITTAPTANVIKFNGTTDIIIIGAVTFVATLSDPDLFVVRVNLTSLGLTDFSDFGNYLILGSVAISTIPQVIERGFSINAEDLSAPINNIVVPSGVDWISFVKDRIVRLHKAQKRILVAQDGVQSKVEDIQVIFSRTKITAGDTPLFEFTVFDPNTFIREDLTASTVTFKGVLVESPFTVAWNRDCDIIDEETGSCEIQLINLETATSGLYEAKIILTRPGPEVLTSQSFIIDILPP